MFTTIFLAVEIITSILLLIGGLIIGLAAGYFIRVKTHEKSLKESREESERIVEEGRNQAEKLKRDAVIESKKEIHDMRKTFEHDMRERRQIVISLEEKANIRDENLNIRSQSIDRREESLNLKEDRLDERKEQIDQLNSKVDELIKEQEDKLVSIASLTRDEAHNIIMETTRDMMSQEIGAFVREEEEKAKSEVQLRAKSLLTLAIQKYASETTSERTVTIVEIPNEEMKGRIIGREGRNIRTLEALTGVDLIIDDTPDAVVLSGFDPIRREIAHKALNSLVSDGRIHPGRIEEVVEKAREEVDQFIREAGEEAVFVTSVGKVHPDLIKLLGRLNYRTSYGQNVLKHSMEVAFLAGKLAAEIGENEVLAKRAGLLHDIGKAVDHEIEGSHVEIGVDIVKRYREPLEVMDAIASHHGDEEPKTIIAVLVAAADALSAARPGARSESMEGYIKRLTQLEEIANDIKGVEKSYAISAGREVRVIVRPSEIDDLSIITIARRIKEEIEQKMTYPGTIKVTVIRELRATDVAK